MNFLRILSLLMILFWGCTFSNVMPLNERADMDYFGSVIIDETKEDSERIVAVSNYCEVVRSCVKRRISVPKNVVLQSFQIEEKKCEGNMFAYGFRVKSPLEIDFPHNACTIVCRFDGDEVYSIDYDLGIE